MVLGFRRSPHHLDRDASSRRGMPRFSKGSFMVPLMWSLASFKKF